MKVQKRCAPGVPEYKELDSGLGVGTGSRTEEGTEGFPSPAQRLHWRLCCSGCRNLSQAGNRGDLPPPPVCWDLCEWVLGGQMVRFEHKKKKNTNI